MPKDRSVRAYLLQDALLAMLPVQYGVAVQAIAEMHPLWNGEHLPSRVGERRRLEFATGRHCARAALMRAGGAAASLAVGRHGEPDWPSGWTGSISHDGGVAAAIALSSELHISVGLDLLHADHWGIADTAQAFFLSGEEQCLIADQLDAARAFAAKEASVKALFPFVKATIDPLHITLTSMNSAGGWAFMNGRTVRLEFSISGEFLLCVAHLHHE